MNEELKSLLEEQNKAFAEFKQANDACLKAKAEGKAVSELQAKVEAANEDITRLGKELNELAKKANRPGAGSDDKTHVEAEHKAAWERWARKGDDAGLAELEAKAVSVGTPADGGYAMPIEQDREILRLLRNESPMRQVCRVVTIGTEDYRKLVHLGGTASGWVGEKASRPETGTPTLAEIKPVMGEIYANPAVTQKALDDLFFNVESELSADIVTEFAEQEGIAFLSGDGANKPKGLLSYPQAAIPDKTRPFGTLQFLSTGVAAGFKASSNTVHPADDLVDLIYTLKKGHRNGATFMMNGKTLSTIRKWKDKDGNYIWQPGMTTGQPSQILGYSVTENEDMPDVGAGAIPLMFGNYQRAYWIIDRIGIRSLRDPYTNKPYVHFYTTKRVGGMLVDSEAVKLLKCAAAA